MGSLQPTYLAEETPRGRQRQPEGNDSKGLELSEETTKYTVTQIASEQMKRFRKYTYEKKQASFRDRGKVHTRERDINKVKYVIFRGKWAKNQNVL